PARARTSMRVPLDMLMVRLALRRSLLHRRARRSARRFPELLSRSLLFCEARPRSVRWVLRFRAFARTWPWEIAELSPVAERSGHPAQITIARERFQHYCGELAQRAHRPRIARHRCKSPSTAARTLNLRRPLELMLSGALLP